MSVTSSNIQDVTMYQQAGKVKVVAGYALQQRLGSGSFATVYKGVRIPDASENDNSDSSNDALPHPDNVAIKAISRTSEKLTKKVLQNLEIEISILRTYRHPNIVCMHDVQKTDRHFYLILEYCGGGDVQRLIRTRKAGRLSERLTRRLMRDLASGLRFLWGQELIHRDIKPQNLLLTGALPLDEVDDPENTPEGEAKRRQINFPSPQFSLKIADFGFARHLQTASLAETLCGSPLYMAPEILQHHRYDAKADLWSVGTVLFEMIAGRPPFNGENHIDLLRNIQRKAVRLPPEVRISKPCVTLLRLLLNRNPLSRAGFKEFFEACDAFVALGCEGVATQDVGSCTPSKDLGTIHENDNATKSNVGSDSLMTVATTSQPAEQQQPYQQQQTHHQQQPQQPQALSSTAQNQIQISPVVSPPFTSRGLPSTSTPNDNNMQTLTRNYPNRLAPLTQSPPTSGLMAHHSTKIPPALSLPQQQRQTQYNTETSLAQSQASTDSGFVMVEHGANSRNDVLDPTVGSMNMIGQRPDGSRPSSLYYINSRPPAVLGNNTVGMGEKRPSKGMLSTSPGTGGFLMGLYGRAQRIGYDQSNEDAKLGDQIAAAHKMLAASEDVGRRAVSVAHLGDARAYLGMRLAHSTMEGSSLLSASPMEGVEEDRNESASHGASSDDSSSTEIMTVSRRRSSVSIDKVMTDPIAEEEEMPFAISPDAPTVSLPSRSNLSVYSKSNSMSSLKKAVVKPDPQTIRSHLGEALSCYLKALKMLKSAVGAAQRVSKDLENLMTQTGRSPTDYDIPKMRKRCEVTSTWLRGQFCGVLERAEAANVEISKLQIVEKMNSAPVTSVEELIYNHALASGRDGAVKQLLGQYEAARTCYRSAGLLAETLLMESGIGAEDRKILEGYVDGFAARINELDHLMLQQSRMTGSSSPAPVHRGSGIIGLIGPPASVPSGFMVAPSPR